VTHALTGEWGLYIVGGKRVDIGAATGISWEEAAESLPREPPSVLITVTSVTTNMKAFRRQWRIMMGRGSLRKQLIRRKRRRFWVDALDKKL
jgi:hypothetical protein